MLLPRRCRGSLCVWSAHVSSKKVVGCHVPHWRRSSNFGGRARSGSATIFPNRNSSRLLGRGSIEIESPHPLVSTCHSDVAHFSVWCCDVLRCFALLVRLLQLLSVRCDVRKRCAGALSCAVLLRALSDCARTRHV